MERGISMNHFETGNLIRILRLQHNYTQRHLAEKLDVSHRDIQAWEDGQVFPDEDKLQEMAELFHVTRQELLEGKLDIPEDPFDVHFRNLIMDAALYIGLFVTLLGISLFIFVHAIFIVHIFFVVIGMVLARFVGFRFAINKPKKQYFLIAGLCSILVVTLIIVNPNYYLGRREEYIRINDYKEHLYLTELGPETGIVNFHNVDDELLVAVYMGERPDFDIINLSLYRTTDILPISTNKERVVDIVLYQEKLYVSTLGETNDDIFTIYEYDPNDYTDTILYQSDKPSKLYVVHNQLLMISHPIFGYSSTEVYRLDDNGDFMYIKDLPYSVWDIVEYTVEYRSMLLASVTSGDIVEGVMMQEVILVDNDEFITQDVLVDNLIHPLLFEGTNSETFGYNQDVIYRFEESKAKKIRFMDGFNEFTIIDDGLYYADYQFFDKYFNIIQKHEFYDDQLNRFEFGSKMIPDDNGNFYTLDNEFIGFGVQMNNEFYIWMLPIGLRVTYMIISVGTVGLVIRLGQKNYQRTKYEENVKEEM